jgi:hypothetical protein
MSDAPITDEEAADLWAKINTLDLSDPQRALLKMVFTIACDVTGSGESLDSEFAGSFEPGQAALILAYQGGTDYMITRAVGAGPHMISRLISR